MDLREKHSIRSWLPDYMTASKTLIETGSHEGEGIESAFAYGYEKVFSIDIEMRWYKHCQHRFQNEIELGRLVLFFGDSQSRLHEMVRAAGDGPHTFWLDAHGNGFSPIMEELAILTPLPVKNHNILIDDMRDFKAPYIYSISQEDIKKAIKKINPKYKFEFLNTGIKNNVLAATV